MADGKTVREQRIMKKLAEATTEQEREELRQQLEREQSRSKRIGVKAPPKKKARQFLQYDRPTEEAIEFLRDHAPMVDHKRIEWTTFHRQILQEAARALGWTPPE